eukprot:Gb_18594 [translate_table: standard]
MVDTKDERMQHCWREQQCCNLHSDLAEAERASSIEKFRQAVVEWNLKHDVEPEACLEEDVKRQGSWMLVMTDSCLPMQSFGEAPIFARVLINYDLPVKKIVFACLEWWNQSMITIHCLSVVCTL